MEPAIGLSAGNLEKAAHALNSVLADEYLLYTKTRNAHWNVEGPDFHSKHLFFESQYQQLDEILDSVAERIRTLGHYAPASLKNFLEITRLSEQLHENNTGVGFIHELLKDHESLIINLRGKIDYTADKLHDMGTSDYMTGLAETHEKMAWMLRAHLK